MFLDAENVGHDFSSCELVLKTCYNGIRAKQLFHLFNILFCPTDLLMEILSILMQLFFPVYDNNHWHVHVLNIPTSRVEILFSLPLRRGNGISTVSRRLSKVIDKAFHDHGMLRRLEVSKFVHVQPQIVQQQNWQITFVIIIFTYHELCGSDVFVFYTLCMHIIGVMQLVVQI